MSRNHLLNDLPVKPERAFVLYWMTTARRMRSNFALQRAVALANELRRPLLVLEALRCQYPWASDRFHTFIIEGMAENARVAAQSPVLYYPYVEEQPGRASGLIDELSSDAAVVVTDWYPGFFIPRMLQGAVPHVHARFEAIDSNGLIPLSEHGRAFPTARGYRAFMQRSLKTHLAHFAEADPLQHLAASDTAQLKPAIVARWPALSTQILGDPAPFIRSLPIDHSVVAVKTNGGSASAAERLGHFISDDLSRYGDDSNHPDLNATSRLSPYLHFGHISAHEVFAAVMTAERWTTRKLSAGASGAREGWWGTSKSAEHFLDQLVVWRELAFNGAHYTARYGSYETLPAWARRTLEQHQSDERSYIYDIDTLDAAATHDPIWNAAMQQMKDEGWFHGYMRMLWGKKILEWSRTPAAALEIMERLMNRYSLDGRDPVSYASYGWVLGLYDRPWPERPIFGVVRTMTTASAARKLKLKSYVQRYATGVARNS